MKIQLAFSETIHILFEIKSSLFFSFQIMKDVDNIIPNSDFLETILHNLRVSQANSFANGQLFVLVLFPYNLIFW